MRETPRVRRLRTDLRMVEALSRESTILEVETHGDPTELYLLRFRGRGVHKPPTADRVIWLDEHVVQVRLGPSYPRMMPSILWQTPIFHPNVATSGAVCLGGYGTHWAPSVTLEEVCHMLWDMIRYKNFDVNSPYNREAAFWAKHQTTDLFPFDRRPLRDRVADAYRDRSNASSTGVLADSTQPSSSQWTPTSVSQPDVITAEIVEAQIVPSGNADFPENGSDKMETVTSSPQDSRCEDVMFIQ